MQKINSAYRTAWHLTETSRKNLMVLLTVITVFKIEVPLVIPYMIQWVFEAVEQNSVESLFVAAGKGLLIFSINILLMYFINVYGDAWAMKLAFCAAENAYKDISRLSVSDMKRKFSEGDLFNRIASGTGQIVGLWFATIDMVSALTAVVIILILFAGQAGVVFGLALALVCIDIIRVVITYIYVNRKTEEIEKKKSLRLGFLKSMIESHTFHAINGTENMVFDKYRASRLEYLRSMEQKINFVAVCDAVSEVIHNIVVALLGHSYFSLRQSGAVSMGKVNSSYNLFSSLKNTAESYVQTMMGLSGKFVPIERLNDLLKTEDADVENGKFCKLQNISYEIDDKKVLNNISIEVSKGEKVAVIGDNGSGKSTILKCICGILNGEDTGKYNYSQYVSYMPAELKLFNSQSCYTNIQMGNELSRAEALEHMLALSFSKPEELLDRNSGGLSGGEKQRIILIRTMISDKDMILLDEPTSALDEESIKCVKKLLRDSRVTLVYVTHLPELARMADKIYIVKNGEIIDRLGKDDIGKSKNYEKWCALK